jgi:hypothetical protein
MSNPELYEIARQRIDRRNRRWTIWAVHLAAFLAYVGFFVAIAETEYVLLGVFGLLAWAGVFTLHTIVLAMNESREKDIEKEVAKLQALGYEKPKRDDGELVEDEKPKYVEIGEDGELVEVQDEDYTARRQNR